MTIFTCQFGALTPKRGLINLSPGAWTRINIFFGRGWPARQPPGRRRPVGAGGRARRGLTRRPREAWPLIKTRATPAGNNILKMSSPLHNCCVVLRPEETAVRGAEGARRRKGPLRSFIALSRYSYTARRRALASAPLSHPRASERPPRVGSTPRRRAVCRSRGGRASRGRRVRCACVWSGRVRARCL